MDLDQMGSEFIADPTAVMLAWMKEREGRDEYEFSDREIFDCGRAAACMDVLVTLATLKSLPGQEGEYALAYGALEGVLRRMGMEDRVVPMYVGLSRWRRDAARRRAYEAAYGDAADAELSAVPDAERASALEARIDAQPPPEDS